MSHMCLSHVTHVHESCHIWKWVTSHIGMSHVQCKWSKPHHQKASGADSSSVCGIVFVFLFVRVGVLMQTHTHTHRHTQTHTHTHKPTKTHTYMHTHKHTHKHIHAHTHTHKSQAVENYMAKGGSLTCALSFPLHLSFPSSHHLSLFHTHTTHTVFVTI